MSYQSFEWAHEIAHWAEERGLVRRSSFIAQTGKLLEEVSELIAARLEANPHDRYVDTMDAIGDCTVVLTIICEQCGIDYAKCIERAWNEIKDRKGKMVNGVFVKESDLGEEEKKAE